MIMEERQTNSNCGQATKPVTFKSVKGRLRSCYRKQICELKLTFESELGLFAVKGVLGTTRET